MIKKYLILTIITFSWLFEGFASAPTSSEKSPEAATPESATEALPPADNTSKDAPADTNPAETPLGVDPTSPNSDTQAPIPEAPPEEPAATAEIPPVHGVDFDFLYNCANAPNMNQQKCDTARYFFCTGRCTRLNCAILTNRKICVEVCGTAHPMMEGCIAAGKRNPAVAALADSMVPMMPYPQPGMNPMMGAGMNPGMAGAAMMGGVAASAIGSLFGKKKR